MFWLNVEPSSVQLSRNKDGENSLSLVINLQSITRVSHLEYHLHRGRSELTRLCRQYATSRSLPL
jgi:hypothetical protein